MTLTFVIPGDLEARTGGYGYDRRLIAEWRAAGGSIETVLLPGDFPFPSDASLAAAEAAFAAVPDGGALLIDGLAYAAIPDVLERHRARIAVTALCHHPLGLEHGLSPDAAAALIRSETAALAAARAVVVTSPATARTLVADFGVPEGRITVAVPGTDPAPLAPGGNQPPVLLTIASLIPRKGHDVLVDALDRIRDRPWTARFVGGHGLDPHHAQAILARIDALGLSDRIVCPGSVSDAEPEYAAADLFVLPSRYEGYGMAFAEAMVHGLPVIAARAGAVPDVVPPEAGILVEPDDVAGLAAALARLLDDPAERARYRDGARAAAARLPTWADTAATVAAAVRAAMERS